LGLENSLLCPHIGKFYRCAGYMGVELFHFAKGGGVAKRVIFGLVFLSRAASDVLECKTYALTESRVSRTRV